MTAAALADARRARKELASSSVSAIARATEAVMSSPEEIALLVFERVQEQFPELTTKLDRSPTEVDLTLDIPRQSGLLFPVHLNLQNVDELHLCVGEFFWIRCFPCTKPEIADGFIEAVEGVLCGTYRVLEYTRNGRYLRGYLQRSEGLHWKTISRHTRGFALPWSHKQLRVLRNVAP